MEEEQQVEETDEDTTGRELDVAAIVKVVVGDDTLQPEAVVEDDELQPEADPRRNARRSWTSNFANFGKVAEEEEAAEEEEEEDAANDEGKWSAEDRAVVPSQEDEQSEKRREMLLKSLEKFRLFAGCSREFLEVLVSKSTRQCLAPNEPLKMVDDGPLFVVETGALRLRVGSEGGSMSASVIGCGAVMNGSGFLGLVAEATQFRPRRMSFQPEHCPKSTRAAGYDVQGYDGDPPSIYTDRQGRPKPIEEMTGPPDSQRCFFNVCPYSTSVRKNPGARGSWMSITVNGGGPNEQPRDAGTACLPRGGATVLILPTYQQIIDLGKKFTSETATPEQQNVAQFQQNCKDVTNCWREVMSKQFSDVVFPGVPVEVVFSVAAAGVVMIVAKGQDIVQEGDRGEDGDSLVLMVDGVAMVLKKIKTVKKVVQVETIGRLRAGAIIGDISLIGADIPRSATVRAKTDVEVIRFPARALLGVLARFPGMLEGCTERLIDAAECLKERLLTRTEVASSLNLFSGCDLNFVNDVANLGERRLLFAGDTVVQQGSTVGTLFLLEHGRCTVEIGGIGTVAEVPTGNCFGERTLLGIAAKANATVRVFTPFALALAIPRDVLNAGLELHPTEKDHFERLKVAPSDGRVAGSKVMHVELFRPCGFGFLESLNSAVSSSCFLPGQTIVVEGDVERDPCMFVLTGGIIVAERGGRPLARMSPGATFGELAMLGLSMERAVTIRAVTMCFVMAIPSTVFFRALTQFPEEKGRFDRVLTDTTKGPGRVVWPCLRGESSRLLYLLDLYSEKASWAAGDKSNSFSEAAILVMEGEISVLNAHGEEVDVLTTGCCFNERILVGVRAKQSVRLVPVTNCEVVVLNREVWGKVMAEFPHDLEKVRMTILRYMGAKAEKTLGYEPASPDLLREKVAFFSWASESFAKVARDLAEIKCYEPGAEIVPYSDWKEGDDHDPNDASKEDTAALYVVLSGTARAECPYLEGGSRPITPGEVIGEGVFVGACRNYSFGVKAETLCIVQVLHRRVIFPAMEQHSEADAERLRRHQEEVIPLTYKMAQWRLPSSAGFAKVDISAIAPVFFRTLSRSPDMVVFAPGSIILQQGDVCALGQDDLFLIVCGVVRAEGSVGTRFGTAGTGEVFGEVGAFEICPYRSATAKAGEDGLVCCLRMDGPVIKAALAECPTVIDMLHGAWTQTETQNVATERQRRKWIETCAIPALARTPLLAGCPKDFIFNLAVMLNEQTFQAGEVIMTAGCKTQSMLLIMKGIAIIEGRNGEQVGKLTAGSVFGEVNVLGLFPCSMATLRASTACRAVALPESSLREVLSSSVAREEGIHDAFQNLVDCRHAQVARGVPMVGLVRGASPSDLRVRAIALIAERIEMQPGETWTPVSDDDPCGPFFGVLLQGRVIVEIGQAGHPVMTLQSGSLFMEGLAAHYGAVARAETYCEAYRVRKSDFLTAVGSNNPPPSDWIWKFKLMEQTAREETLNRLQSGSGLVQLSVPHRMDSKIQAWKNRRQHGLSRAGDLRRANEGCPMHQRLPPLAQLAGGYAESELPSEPSRMSAGASGSLASLTGKPGLMCYPVLQLPRLPQERSKGNTGVPLGSSKSAPSLRKRRPPDGRVMC